MSKHVLLVDDDALLRRSLAFNLQRSRLSNEHGRQCRGCSGDGSPETHPILILLDIGLPDMDGLDALRHLREQMDVPVIFLTARRRELDQALGLEMGADDYVTKPFDLDVLLARIKAVLRRSQNTAAPPAEAASLTVGDLTIDPTAHTATLAGKPVDLPPREFDLLHTLALEAGHVLSAEDLLARVWGAEYEGEPQVVYVHIRWLREKLEKDPHHPGRLITVRGVGYKLEPQES